MRQPAAARRHSEESPHRYRRTHLGPRLVPTPPAEAEIGAIDETELRVALRKLELYCRHARGVVRKQPGLHLEIHFLRMVSFIAARAMKKTQLSKTDLLADLRLFVARLDAGDRLAFDIADLYVQETARGRFSKAVRAILHGPLEEAERRIRDALAGRPVEIAEGEPRGLLRLAAQNVVRTEKSARRQAQLRRRLVALDLYPKRYSSRKRR